MKPLRVCCCPEEEADETDFNWHSVPATETNAHTHPGCRVLHKGLICTINDPQMALPGLEGKP